MTRRTLRRARNQLTPLGWALVAAVIATLAVLAAPDFPGGF